MRKQIGFTLIELMIAMGIIGLLAAIAMPAYSSYRTKAANTAALSDVKLIVLNELAFYGDYHVYVDFLPSDVNAVGLLNKSVTIGTQTFNFSFPLSGNVESIVKTDASKQTATAASHSNIGNLIVAMEVERGNIVKKKTSTTVPMDTALIPASTTAEDLATWANW
jgi:prepilin-type N-terminal cleavage/methylation domain-containing protein